MRLLPGLTVMVALALVACGADNVDSTIPPRVATPTAALTGWADFPAGQTPRPVVLIGNHSPTGGFGTNDAKIAALCHKFTSSITLPTAIPRSTAVSWSTGEKRTYPSISAAAAMATMTQPGPGTSEPYCKTVPALEFSAVRFGAYQYVTDRGKAQIDSWLFATTAFSGEIAYPALARPSIWNADLLNGYADYGTTVSTDGLTLAYAFIGASGTGPCAVAYHTVVAESPTAVAVAVQAAAPTSACNGPSDAVGYPRTVNVSLAGPLGGRVLLDETGNVTTVCPAFKPEC